LKGSMEVNSKPGKGTLVFVSIPLAVASQVA
jgi:chemotaxis protein histidine kinase CheA